MLQAAVSRIISLTALAFLTLPALAARMELNTQATIQVCATCAFTTIQTAVNSALNDYDTRGNDVFVVVAPGAYNYGARATRPMVGGGMLHIVCDAPGYSVLNDALCTVDTIATAFSAMNGANIRIYGFRLRSPGYCLFSRYSGQVWFDYIQFDGCAVAGYADEFGKIEQFGDIAILAGGENLYRISHQGNGRISGGAVVWLADATYTAGVFWLLTLADFTITGPTTMVPGQTPFILNGHAVTGKKAVIHNNSAFQWNSHLCSELPGSEPVDYQFGGQCLPGP